MDAFIASVATQTFHLNAFDAYLSSATINLVSFYENTMHDAGFMDSAKLKQAFYRALSAFPVYAGEPRWNADGQLELIVDNANLNMPGYQESTSSIPFADIAASKFSPQSWPSGILSVDATPLPDSETGRVRMLHVHVVRCKDNSGVAIFVSANHVVADGTGFYAFIGRWAGEAHALVKGVAAPVDTFYFDRTSLSETPAASRKVLTPQEFAQFQLLFSTERNMEWHEDILASGYEGSLYRINGDKLDNLRREVVAHTSGNKRLSTNDVISALISKTFAQAVKDKPVNGANQTSTSVNNPDASSLQNVLLACNVRPRLGAAYSTFMGNALYALSFTQDFDDAASDTTAESLARVAYRVRGAVDAVQKQQVREFFNKIEGDPMPFTYMVTAPDTHRHSMLITNHSRFKIYEADFGYGSPVFASPRPHSAKPGVRILPVHPPSNDLYVFFIDTPPMLTSIRKNKSWSRVAEFVYWTV